MQFLKKAEDHELIQNFIDGNDFAFEILIRRHKSMIYEKIYFIVRNKLAAEDILQECFIRILQSIRNKGYNENGKFLPWALTIATNLCIDHKRKKKRNAYCIYEHEASTLLRNQSVSLPCKMSERQLQQQIEYILNKLPEEQKTVIRFRHYDEMSYKEISSAMGTNVSTAIARMRYGLHNLNRMIGSNRSAFVN
jgi:RNA polymerase sigma-70 factor (ECF subfamily)